MKRTGSTEFSNGVFVKKEDEEFWVRLRAIDTVRLVNVQRITTKEKDICKVVVTLKGCNEDITLCSNEGNAANYYANLMEELENEGME